MKKSEETKGLRLLAVLLALNLLATVCVIGYLAAGRRAASSEAGSLAMEAAEKYIIYVGTNDKDTYTQLIPFEECRQIVNEICARYAGGYTEIDAQGGWFDENDALTQEQTLVYEFYNIDEGQLYQIMDEILTRLNQNSILVERQEAVYTYYTGA